MDKLPEGYDMYAMAHTASYKQVKGKARKGEEFNPRQIPYNPEQVMISSGGRSRGSIATSRKQGFRPGQFSPLVPVQSRTGTNVSIYPGLCG